MATNTYVALDRVTLGSDTAQVTFSNISGAYTDLVLVINGGVTTLGPINVQVNNDTGTNYSYTRMYGSGTTASSDRFTSQSSFDVGYFPNSLDNNAFVHFMNYSNTTTNKTILNRWNSTGFTTAVVGLWRSTAAITSIKLFNASPYNLKAGSTFSLYGIKAEGASGTKATGGAIYSDSTYYYHVFGSTGTFTPTQSLTADILCVAGGGGGGGGIGGGGGAGGLRTASAQSLTTTAYTITVGGGGAGGSSYNAGTSGVNSSVAGSGFTTFTSSGGGGGAGQGTSQNALTGGSGGGGTYNKTSGAAGNSGSYSPVEGYAGGNGLASSPYFAGGGGGGAGAVGSVAVTTTGGTGGAGNSTLTTWISATGIGVSGVLAGGGGGGSQQPTGAGAGGSGGGGIGGLQTAAGADVTRPGNGVVNTGSGGGGDGTSGSGPAGSGGSGIVIIRYAK